MNLKSRSILIAVVCVFTDVVAQSVPETKLLNTGEEYRLNTGRVRKLPRLAGTVFIQVDAPQFRDSAIADLSSPGSLLEGFTARRLSDGDKFFMEGPPEVATTHAADPNALAALLDNLRRLEHIRVAIIATGSGSSRQVIVGGQFTSVQGYSRNRLARVNNNGGIDTSFANSLGLNGTIWTMAKQSDGKIVLGGDFTTFDGSDRHRIARATTSGLIDTSFAPTYYGTDGTVYSVLLDADQDILIGGAFNSVNGAAGKKIARLRPNGASDPYFDVGQGPNYLVYSLSLWADGKISAGGTFTSFDGEQEGRITRIHGK